MRDSSHDQVQRPGIFAQGVAGAIRTLIAEQDLMTTLSWMTGIGAIAVLLGSTLKTTPPYVIGDALVSSEVYVLPWIYMKPMTLFTFLFFLSYAFGLSSISTRERFMRMTSRVRSLINVAAWLFVMGSGFEIVYHIVLWSAALAVQGLQNPDLVVNPWPNNPYPINVVFSSKLVVLIFAASCFTIDYISRIEREKELRTMKRAEGLAT